MSAVLEAWEPSARYLEAVPPTLVRQFDLLATAQGGAARLRELIVLLALQGKLVQQDPQEASALDWLATIQARRDTLSAKGLVKTGKNLPPVEECERWFDLPATWTWARLSDLVVSSEAGWSPSCPETPRRGESWGVLKVSAVSWGKFDPAANKELPDELTPRPEYEVRPGDFLLSRANTAELVARSVVVAEAPPRLMLSDKIIRLTFAEGVNRAFINLCNNSGAARSYYVAKASGTSSSMKNVSREVVLGLPIPVPPVDEQARIVARVDELMRLCDALEANGRLEAEQHARLLGTLLGTLTDSSTPEELAANWQRVADHFDLLLDRPEAVDALEQTILQLAVRGLLVQQDPSDEPASELLGRIAADRGRLIAEGKVAKRATSEATVRVVAPFDIPTSWLWVEFADYIHELCTGPFGSVIHKEDYVQGGVPLINPSHMIDGEIRHDPNISVPQDLANRLGAYRLSAGDVLMARRGEVGRYALVTEREAGWLCGTGSFFVRLASFCNRDYFGLMLQDPRLRAHLLGESVGATMTNLNQRILLQAPIAVPPLNEQARIVARVAEIRRLCADLRQRLAARQTTQSHLAEALVTEVA